MLNKQIKIQSEISNNNIMCMCELTNSKYTSEAIYCSSFLYKHDLINDEYTQFIINDLIDNILSEIIRCICKLNCEYMFGVNDDPIYNSIFEIAYNHGFIPQKEKIFELYFESDSIAKLRKLLNGYYKGED